MLKIVAITKIADLPSRSQSPNIWAPQRLLWWTHVSHGVFPFRLYRKGVCLSLSLQLFFSGAYVESARSIFRKRPHHLSITRLYSQLVPPLRGFLRRLPNCVGLSVRLVWTRFEKLTAMDW